MDLRKVVGSDVMRVHDQEAYVARVWVKIDTKQRKGELAATNHDRRALRLEVVDERARAARNVVARGALEDLARDTESVLQEEGDVLRSEPLLLPARPAASGSRSASG